MLEHIIPSKTRRKILQLYFENIGQAYHLRKVAREIDEEINAVKRELDILENAGLLRKEKRVNRVIYFLNPKYIFFDELLRICTRQNTLCQSILKNVNKLGKIKYAALSLKFIKKQKIQEGDLFLLFVGVVVLPELTAIISQYEKTLGTEINYSAMNEEEFNFRKKSNDPFIWSFLRQPKLMIIGDEGGLLG